MLSTTLSQEVVARWHLGSSLRKQATGQNIVLICIWGGAGRTPGRICSQGDWTLEGAARGGGQGKPGRGSQCAGVADRAALGHRPHSTVPEVFPSRPREGEAPRPRGSLTAAAAPGLPHGSPAARADPARPLAAQPPPRSRRQSPKLSVFTQWK